MKVIYEDQFLSEPQPDNDSILVNAETLRANTNALDRLIRDNVYLVEELKKLRNTIDIQNEIIANLKNQNTLLNSTQANRYLELKKRTGTINIKG